METNMTTATLAIIAISAIALGTVAALMPALHVSLTIRRHAHDDRADAAAVPERTGIDATIAALIAQVKSGSNVVEAFEEQGGMRFATPRVTAARAEAVLQARATADESDHDIAATARRLSAACRLSEKAGCSLSRCLEAAADDQRRARRTDELRRQTFAMPKATIRLLTALPGMTVLLGELLGARPVAFLLGSPQGLLCLIAGAVWYVVGLAWTRRLLGEFSACAPHSDLPITMAMLKAVLAQGASIPGALIAVGEAFTEGGGTTTARTASAGHSVSVRTGWQACTGRIGPAGTAKRPTHGGRTAEDPRIAEDARPARLRAAGFALTRGATWHEAWIGGAGGMPADPIRDCLGDAWMHGASPTGRLELAIERYERDKTATIEQAAAALSVRLLAPTGLCFLPAFMLIGVIPAIVSFAM